MTSKEIGLMETSDILRVDLEAGTAVLIERHGPQDVAPKLKEVLGGWNDWISECVSEGQRWESAVLQYPFKDYAAEYVLECED